MSQSQQTPPRPVPFVKITMRQTRDGYPVKSCSIRMVIEQSGPYYILKEDGTRVWEEPPFEKGGQLYYESVTVTDNAGNTSQLVAVPPTNVFYSAQTGQSITFKTAIYTNGDTCLDVFYHRAVVTDVDLFTLLDYPDAIPGNPPPDGAATQIALDAEATTRATADAQRLRNAGDWNNTATFALNDFVTFNGLDYRALQAVPANTQPGSTAGAAYWKALGGAPLSPTALVTVNLTSVPSPYSIPTATPYKFTGTVGSDFFATPQELPTEVSNEADKPIPFQTTASSGRRFTLAVGAKARIWRSGANVSALLYADGVYYAPSPSDYGMTYFKGGNLLFSDSAGTTPSTDGGVVALWKDTTGGTLAAMESIPNAQPKRNGDNGVTVDGSDALQILTPLSGGGAGTPFTLLLGYEITTESNVPYTVPLSNGGDATFFLNFDPGGRELYLATNNLNFADGLGINTRRSVSEKIQGVGSKVLVGIRYDGTTLRYDVQGVEMSRTITSGQINLPTLYIGGFNDTAFGFVGKIYDFALKNACLNNTEYRNARAAFLARQNYYQAANPLCLYYGNSFVAGIGVPTGQDMPTQITQRLTGGLAGNEMHNYGIGGSPTADLLNCAQYWGGTGRKRVCLLWELTNSLRQSLTAQQIYDQYKAAFLALPSNTWGVGASPLPQNGDSALEAKRIALRDLLYADHSFMAGFADVAANPQMGAPGAWQNGTYYNASDGLHPTVVGFGILADITAPVMQNVINSIT